MTPPQHPWFLTPKAIDGIATQCGLLPSNCVYPWKTIPLSLVAYQLKRITGWSPMSDLLNAVGVPLNLFDAMRVTLRKAPTKTSGPAMGGAHAT